MSVINLSLPTGESVCSGKHISFSAPCACTGVTGVKVGDTTYSLVNSEGNDYVSSGGSWASGAYLTVMLDCTNNKAYMVSDHQAVPSWAMASSKPTYTASEVGALPDTIFSFDSTSNTLTITTT